MIFIDPVLNVKKDLEKTLKNMGKYVKMDEYLELIKKIMVFNDFKKLINDEVKKGSIKNSSYSLMYQECLRIYNKKLTKKELKIFEMGFIYGGFSMDFFIQAHSHIANESEAIKKE